MQISSDSHLIASLIPVGTLLLGWLLNELHRVVAGRKEHVASIRRTLAYLLEVRFQLRILEHLVQEIKCRSPETQSEMPQMRMAFEALLGFGNNLNEKYEEAVEAIAGQDPFLAYELTSRSRISTIFQDWRNMALSSGAAGEELEQMESDLKQLIGPSFDEIIVSIAGNLSWFSKRRVKKILSKPFELSPEMSKLFDQHVLPQHQEGR